MSETATDDDSDAAVTAPDPETVAERDGVEVVEKTRTFEDEKFEGLRERYDQIAGVAMVGVVDDGAVLLQGEDTWSPPGGSVLPGADWAESIAETLEQRTGVPIVVEEAVLVEFSEFRREGGDEDESFPASAVHFRASLAEPSPAFRENPTFADDFDGAEYFEDTEYGWFETVPEDVHPNHEDHVRLFVD